MSVLAITSAAARHLLAHSAAAQLAELLPSWTNNARLRASIGSAWNLRVGADRQNTDRLVIWHPDYVSGTGTEDWAFILLSGEFGLLEQHEYRIETLERILYIAERRLDGLLLDGSLINKTIEGGGRRCVLGRGGAKQQLSVVYLEEAGTPPSGPGRSILLSGATREEVRPLSTLASYRPHLAALKTTANLLVYDSLRPSLDLAPPIRIVRRTDTPLDLPVTRLEVGDNAVSSEHAIATEALTYADWILPGSPLNEQQRRILNARQIASQPLRIVGAAGSGKTLLMTLLAGRVLNEAKEKGEPCTVLYVTHNSAMRDAVFGRMINLGYEEFLAEDKPQQLKVSTLAEHAQRELNLDDTQIIDRDAAQTKEYQSICVREAIQKIFHHKPQNDNPSPLYSSDFIFQILPFVTVEIGLAIKGHGLQQDASRYIDAEKPLSRLHSVLTKDERRLVFEIFEEYNRRVFLEDNLLDSDDIALSLLGRLRTPLWRMQRKKLGVDFLFVDEAQLFNDNERRLFALLTRGTTDHIPAVLALDEAQDLSGIFQAGLGTLGIDSIHNETLLTNHRCTPAIIQLAMYVLQRTTDLFSASYPNISGSTVTLVPDAHPHADAPKVVYQPKGIPNFSDFVLGLVSELRNKNIRTIAISFHSDLEMKNIEAALRGADQPIKILRQRGEKLQPKGPLVVLGRAEDLGGQEFDAVICIGLEQGVTPPVIQVNQALDSAFEQRALREMYLAFTRARYRLLVPIAADKRLTPILQQAEASGLLRTAKV